MSKAKLVTRSETTSTVTDDNLGKAAALTHAEMDSNLINLRDASWGLADDSSTVLSVTNDKTVSILGGSGISTALSGDTLTITASESQNVFNTIAVAGQSNIVADATTDTLTIAAGTGISITTDAGTDTLTITGTASAQGITVVGDDSTGTLIGDGETIKIAGGANITTAMSGDTLTITGTGGGSGAVTALNNQAENRITTIGSTTTELDGEANLTFDGSTLTLTGTAALDGVTITDNTISTNASNADLEISANGTGSVALGAGTIDNTVLAHNVLQSSGASDRGATRSYLKTIDWSTASSNNDRIYGNTDYIGVTVSGSGTGSSRERVRQIQLIQIDSAGYNLPYQHGFYQANANVQATELRNSSTNASTVQEITGNSQFVKVGDNNTAGNITVTDMTGNASNLSIVAPTGTTMSVTNAYGAISTMEQHSGSGTVNLTNYYGFYVDGNSAGAPASNYYGFYVDDDSFSNRIGGVTLQNGAISTDGITINDNNISTSRSNDNLNITANGTGYITLGEDFDVISTNTRYHYGAPRAYTGTHSGSTSQHINSDGFKVQLTGDLTGSGTVLQELRHIFDLNGYDSTASSTKKARGYNGLRINPFLTNTSASASTITEASGFSNFTTLQVASGDITVTDYVINAALPHMSVQSGLTGTITNQYNYYSLGVTDDGGSGTKTVGTLYHYYAGAGDITPSTEYGFYTADAGMNNLIGGVTLQNGAISTDGITINDNEITTSRSNDNLNITANGTGYIALAEDFDVISTDTRYHYGATAAWTGTLSGSTRVYPNSTGVYGTLTGDLTSGGRLRSEIRQRLDLAGFDITGSGAEFISNGLTGLTVNPFLENNSATASTATEMTGYSTQATVNANSGDLSLTNMVCNGAISYLISQAGLTASVTNGYGYVSWGMKPDGGAGTKSLTNYYHYAVKANGNPITPSGSEYAFYDNENLLSRFGAVILANQAGDPSTVADSAHIYAKDDAGSSEVYVRDEAGNVTKISPHNTAGEWEYYSVNRNTGKTVRINMEALVREVEQLSGKKFIENQ